MVHSETFLSASDFVQPNVEVLKTSYKSIQRLFNGLETSVLESLQDKSKRLVFYIQDVDEQLRYTLVELNAKLNNRNLESYVSDLEELSVAQRDPVLAETDKTVLLQVMTETRQSLNQLVAEIEQLFAGKAQLFSAQLTNLEDVLIEVHIPSALEGKNQQKKSLEATIQTNEDKKRSLVSRKNQLIDSLEVMRKHDLLDTFSDYLPTDQEIEGMDLSQPEIELVKQGVNLYRKMLSTVSDGLDYAKLAGARDQLYKEIDQLDAENRNLNQELKRINDELSDVSAMARIDSERDRYTAEARKLVNAWEFFAARLHQLIQLELYSEIGKLFEEKLAYLTAVGRAYK